MLISSATPHPDPNAHAGDSLLWRRLADRPYLEDLRLRSPSVADGVDLYGALRVLPPCSLAFCCAEEKGTIKLSAAWKLDDPKPTIALTWYHPLLQRSV